MKGRNVELIIHLQQFVGYFLIFSAFTRFFVVVFLLLFLSVTKSLKWSMTAKLKEPTQMKCHKEN